MSRSHRKAIRVIRAREKLTKEQLFAMPNYKEKIKKELPSKPFGSRAKWEIKCLRRSIARWSGLLATHPKVNTIAEYIISSWGRARYGFSYYKDPLRYYASKVFRDNYNSKTDTFRIFVSHKNSYVEIPLSSQTNEKAAKL